MPIAEALALAREQGLDLIEVNPVAQPPVCRIIDYGKFQYQREKLQRKQRSKQKKTEIKAVRLTFKIAQHDLAMRLSQARKFLEEGHKVKFEMVLRGRENAKRDLARQRVEDLIRQLGNVRVEQEMKKIGNRLTTVIASVRS